MANTMNNSWTNNEFLSVDLGDERLNKRLSLISERFAQSPLSPINQACEDWAETKAAYRFFSNENVAYKEITKSHIAASKERCIDYSTVLAIQDTTYYNYSQHPKTKGLCPLSRKGKKDDGVTLGLVMHSTFVVGTDGLPLGIADQKIYSRPQPSNEMDAKKRKALNGRLPIEKKDSYRWVESLENTTANLADINGRVVTLCDREADIYNFYLRAQQLGAPFVVRGNYNRTVNKKSQHSEITGEKLWDLLERQESALTIQVQIPKQNDHPARIATCEVRYHNFVMNIPDNYCEGIIGDPTNLNLHAVYVSEINCLEINDPISWMLITNISITDCNAAMEIVQWYCLRWRIETWHKVFKSGLQVEECRLSTSERLIKYLAVMSVVAWRILWVTIIARVKPDVPCCIFLNEFEWKILASKFGKNSKQKLQTPTLEQSIRWIAQLGGFLARKSDKQPGIIHVWRGLKKFSAMLEGAVLAKTICG